MPGAQASRLQKTRIRIYAGSLRDRAGEAPAFQSMGRIHIVSLVLLSALLSCRSAVESNKITASPAAPAATAAPEPTASPTPAIPNLQAELLDGTDGETTHPIGSFDFRNYTYELPRGWQNPDGTSGITLVNGKVAPVSKALSDDVSDEQRLEAKTQRRIGMTFVTAKYMDVTNDGQPEAIVILKVETGGAAVPQLVYIFEWKDGKPELIWNFRTGDRADGGLKEIRSEGGELVVDLYGQDRFLLGQTETGRITGDEEQLCCPTHFTRTHYRWNGNVFLMNKKRLTFSLTEPHIPPQENLGDKVNNPQKKK